MISIEIKKQLNNAILLFTYKSSPNEDYKRYSVSGLTNLRRSLQELEKTNLYTGKIEDLKRLSWFDGYEDQKTIPSTEDSQIKEFISFVRIASEGIKEYLNITNTSNEELVLHIYLPNQYSFSDFVSLSNDLKKCIELPSLDVGGSVKIISAQPGSIWLIIAFTTTAAITIVGKIIKIATRANIEIQKGKIFANYAQSLNLSNEMNKTILEAQKKLIDGIIAKEVEDAKIDIDTSNDITKVERLKLAVTKMSELLRKEIKFLPSPKMEINIMEQFPDENQIETVEKEIKKLMSPKIEPNDKNNDL